MDYQQTTTSAEQGVSEAAPPHQALIARWCKTVALDKKHHDKAFERMREDQKFCANTNDAQWDGEADKYVANITIRHVRNKTGVLYAKNPRVKAVRAERLEYTYWDGNIQSLQAAVEIQQRVAMYSTAIVTGVAPVPQVDPQTGVAAPLPPPPDAAEATHAQMLIQDAVEGLKRKQMLDRVGKTLEILYHHMMREQNPYFKTQLKQLVRRVVTCGVGWIKLGFQRDLERKPETIKQIADATQRLATIQRLMCECTDEGAQSEYEDKKAELENTLAALQEEGTIPVREGITFAFPGATQIIPDRRSRQLVGLMGCNHLTTEHMLSCEEVEEIYGVKLGKGYTGYIKKPTALKTADAAPSYTTSGRENPDEGDLACVWEVQDKRTGTVFTICDGHPDYLRAPAAPKIKVEQFFDTYELVFNAVENEYDLFPPSDVRLLMPQQRERNRNREALREHRIAARPFYVSAFPLEEEQKNAIKRRVPFEVVDGLHKGAPPGSDITKILAPVGLVGVDPNMYDNSPIDEDVNRVVGAPDANFAVTSGGTATESTIAEGARVSSVDDNKDDLDEFLTRLARDGGQILMREISPEIATKIAGPGAAWPEFSRDEMAEELYLEIIAGSSGRPNRDLETARFERLAPTLIQVPGIKPERLARHAVQILDEKIDIDEWIAQDLPSIVALNQLSGKPAAPAAAQPATGDPATDPASQGPMGGQQTVPAGDAQPPPEGAFPAPGF